MDSLMFRRRVINLNLDSYIDFADPAVAEICISNWGDGTGLTRRAAMFLKNNQLQNVFNSNTDITSFNELRFFAGITGINNSVFEGCSNLTSVMLPSSIRYLQASSFSGCSSLESINLVSGIDEIRGLAFTNCSSLAIEINLPNLNSFLAYDAFKNTGITKIKSLGTISTLGYYANFSNCRSLTEVVLPATLTVMNRQHFNGCVNLKTVKILATTPPSVTNSNFYNCGDAKIYVPYSEDHSIINAYREVWGQNAGALENDVPRLMELDINGEIPE